MTDDPRSDDLETPTASSGQTDAILGGNDSIDADAIGANGPVTTTDGDGLVTPDDARIEGGPTAPSLAGRCA